MNIETQLLIAAILLLVIFWLLRNFFNRRISAGQTLFWLTMLTGGVILALFPATIHMMSFVWGDLWPVSWITFAALVFLTFYLLYLTVRVNSFTRINELVRTIAYLERRVQAVEQQNRLLHERLSGR